MRALESRAEVFRFARTAALVVIAAGALALRFRGLGWGLPNELHDYSYHPDEFLTVGAAFGMIYLRHSWNPGFYNYPSFYLYLSALAIALALGYGAGPAPAAIYLCARVVTALMGTAAVAATWWAGRTLFGEAVGLLAALVIAVAPLHVQHSHFATVDVPSTFFVALALGFAGVVLNSGSRRGYLLGGLAAGLAAGTKYNAGLVLLAVIAAHFLREGWTPGSLRSGRFWGAIGCALGAFIVSTPGSVLASEQFLRGIAYEMRHAAEGHGLVFAGTGNGFVYTFTSSLVYGLGAETAVIFLLSVLYSLWRRDKAALVILAFVVPYYALISTSHVRFARYALPLFPAAALVVGRLAWESRHLPAAAGFGRKLVGWAFLAFCCLALLQTGLSTRFLLGLFDPPDPRDEAARWVGRRVPRGGTIGFIDWPWFYSPPLSKDLGFGTLPQRQEAARKAPYRLVVLNWDPTARKTAPEWIIVSDFEVEDALRLQGNTRLSAKDRAQVERVLSNLDWIKKHYAVRTYYGGPTHAHGRPRYPHDMRYPDPAITIYQRRK